MSDAIPPPDQPEPPPTPQCFCRVCREAIKPGAKICNQCNSYQDWRRFIAFGNTTLALIVALISVISISLKYIVDLAPKSKEHVVLGMLETNPENLQLFAYNDGATYGILQPSAILTVHRSDGSNNRSSISINPGTSRDMTSLILKPGDVTAYFASYSTQDRPIKAHDAMIKDCEVSFVVRGPNKHIRSDSFHFPCKG